MTQTQSSTADLKFIDRVHLARIFLTARERALKVEVWSLVQKASLPP